MTGFEECPEPLAHARSHAPMLPHAFVPPLPDTPTLRYPASRTTPELLTYVDVLIAGRYDQGRRLARGLRGSSNKTVHFLTARYTLDDLESVPAAEVVVTMTGEVVCSGIQPVIL